MEGEEAEEEEESDNNSSINPSEDEDKIEENKFCVRGEGLGFNGTSCDSGDFLASLQKR
jgi:hypothetical protein